MSEDRASPRSFGAAVGRLGAAVAQPKTEWTRDAAIQRFECTFELAWKTIARLARREGLESPSPRQALRVALRLGRIGDDKLRLTMVDDRNRTSHTHNEKTAEEIFGHLPAYAEALRALHGRLSSAV
jgi:nucleotidyltransferase substrate binding protein (TIGR01987 family)